MSRKKRPLAEGKPRVDKRLVKSFFEALFEGRLSESEQILSKTSKSAADNEESRRYIQALSGMHYVYSTDDRDSLLMRLIRSPDWNMKRRRVARLMRSHCLAPTAGTSTGFYMAWVDLLRMLPKLPVPHRVRQEREANEGKLGK